MQGGPKSDYKYSYDRGEDGLVKTEAWKLRKPPEVEEARGFSPRGVVVLPTH